MSTARRKPVNNRPQPSGKAAHRWIDSFLDYSRSECHLAANTVAAYRRDLAKFAAWVGARPIQALTIRELGDYAAWLGARKLAPASVARQLVALKVFFRSLQLEGVLKDNLAELLYATGCRASEVSNLRSDDVHLSQGFCLVRGKGDKERLVALGARAIAAV